MTKFCFRSSFRCNGFEYECEKDELRVVKWLHRSWASVYCLSNALERVFALQHCCSLNAGRRQKINWQPSYFWAKSENANLMLSIAANQATIVRRGSKLFFLLFTIDRRLRLIELLDCSIRKKPQTNTERLGCDKKLMSETKSVWNGPAPLKIMQTNMKKENRKKVELNDWKNCSRRRLEKKQMNFVDVSSWLKIVILFSNGWWWRRWAWAERVKKDMSYM